MKVRTPSLVTTDRAIDLLVLPNVVDFMGRTPLHIAVNKNGLEQIANLLVFHGADIRAVNKAGDSPLAIANRHKKARPRLVRILVRASLCLRKGISR